ncbi:MAG: hypothetical protein HDQ88_12100 [Clostridia bacterium]|nr:hypothetical protein [Clostridia bacterium]
MTRYEIAILIIKIMFFIVMPLVLIYAAYFGYKWCSELKEAWDEAEEKSRKSKIKESLEDLLRQSEIRRLEMENTAYSVYTEIQIRNRQQCMNEADIRRKYENGQQNQYVPYTILSDQCCNMCDGCMQYRPEQDNTVIDIGVAEVEREEPKELPEGE